MSENMLKLNVWTPALTGKRPVMIYYHGGGFFFGSSYELPSQEGAQLARHHDVVSVTVNHRLNVLGFFDVSEIGGPAYADSVNVGMTDLVASLQWVRDNIANFGGDPDRVMIYGQSGGGSKVTGLMGMPSAAGLFHRASAQSGGGGNPPSGRAIPRAGPADDERAGPCAQRPRLATKDGLVQTAGGRQRCHRQDQPAPGARYAAVWGAGNAAAGRLGTHRGWPRHYVARVQ